MKLSSKPKPVNFRIVLSSAEITLEITSIESLQKFFHFERLLVTDKSQFISWLKRKDKIRGNKIENIFQEINEIGEAAAITKVLNIIYEPEPAFNDLVDFVNFLYDNNEYEVVKSNFSNYISKHGEELHKLFPIDSVPKNLINIDNLYDFFGSLDVSKETSDYSAQLYYRHDNFEISQKISPSSWKLLERERSAIQAIVSSNQLSASIDVVTSGNLSIIGVEFIFLCAIAFLSFHPNDAQCKVISDLIDQTPSFKLLRDRIGGSMKKVIKKKNPDFFKVFTQLGYTEPHKLDPLFNEKLFLSSFFAEDVKRDVILKEIIEKTDYFPAHYLLGEDGYDSKVLKSRDESLYLRWLSHILDYYDNPTGLDGDDVLGGEVREMAVIARQFKENETIMNSYFHFPNDLDARSRNNSLREHILQIKSVMGTEELKLSEKYGSKEIREKGQQKVFGSWANDSLRLRKKEKEYLNFFKEVIDILNNWHKYIRFNNGECDFTDKAKSLIKKYRENNQTLQKEKLFVVTILLLVRYHNTNRIYEEEAEIKKLRRTYVPLKALFKDDIPLLSLNDKKILQPSVRGECLNKNWYVSHSDMRKDCFYRRNYYDKILKRWVANFIYYTE